MLPYLLFLVYLRPYDMTYNPYLLLVTSITYRILVIDLSYIILLYTLLLVTIYLDIGPYYLRLKFLVIISLLYIIYPIRL